MNLTSTSLQKPPKPCGCGDITIRAPDIYQGPSVFGANIYNKIEK